MGILGPHGLTMHSPFCDALNVTVPFEYSDEVQASCRPVLASLGAAEGSPGHWQVPPLKVLSCGRVVGDEGALRWQKPGSVVFKRYGQVLQVGSSGTTLRTLRADGSFLHWLSILGSYPHKVTRLDATVDMPVPAADLVMGLYDHVVRQQHGISLGRKHTPATSCRGFLSPSLYGAGRETGTVYIGRYGRAEINAKVYDKRQEVMAHGGDDQGDCLRTELTFSGQVGCTLRDAAQPGALFWNYARELLDPPTGFTAWSKGDSGFELERLPPVDPVVAITRACERNEGLRTVIRFSDSLGILRKHLWGYMNHVHPPQVPVGAV